MSQNRVEAGKVLKRANPSTIQDKFLVGYQGWFTCPGDGDPVAPGHHGWLHWFDQPITYGGRPLTDFWPDVSEYSPSELFPTGFTFKNGQQAFLFSSRHPKTVERHFHWMAQHGIDGAFLQRFAHQCDLEAGNQEIKRIRDEVGALVKHAAEKEGRVFAIMYDVSGVPADRLQRVLEQDWNHLVRRQALLDSPNYLKERGQPVVGISGLGFAGSNHTPELIRDITTYFRNSVPGGAYIIGGAPAYWRTSSNDADSNPALVDVWLNEFDAISPWTVGKYKTSEELDNFAEINTKADAEFLKKRQDTGQKKVDYIPVVFPGASGFNLTAGKFPLNDIKRQGGRFLWQQVFNAKRVGARIIYGAMWDEYDEGTCLMPVVEKSSRLPHSDKFPFIALDEEGHDLPSDWYMRICGFAAEGLRSERRVHETFPSKELQDYWASRPKYEASSAEAGGSGSGRDDKADGDEAYKAWLASQKDDKDEPPPPPYSLEAEEPAASSSSSNPVPAASSSSTPAISVASSGSSSGAISGAQQPTVGTITDDFSRHSISSNPAGSAAAGTSSISGFGSPSHTPSTIPTNEIDTTSFPPPRHPSVPPQATPQSNFGARPSSRPTSSQYQSSAGSAPIQNPYPPSQSQPMRPSSQSRPSSSHHISSSQGYAAPLPGTQGYHNRPPSRPNTASGHHQGYIATTPIPPVPGTEGQPSSPTQWPPAEWNANRPQSVPNDAGPYQSYQAGQTRPTEEPTQSSWSGPSFTAHPTGGAKLSRPQTFSASSSRPANASPPDFRPGTSQAITPPHANSFGGPVSFPGNVGPTQAYPSSSYGYGAHSSMGGPAFPTGPSSGPSSYGAPTGNESSYFYSGGPGPNPGHSMPTHTSPPHSPGVNVPGFPSSQPPYGVGPGHYEPHPNMPRPGGGPQFPSGPGGFSGEAHQPYRPPSHSTTPSVSQPQMPAFPNPYDNSAPYPPYNNNASAPYSSSPPGGGPSFPGGPNPPLPPRPSTTQPSSSSSSSSSYRPSYAMPGSSSSSSALGYAMNAVDKYAGKKTKEQLESVMQSGTKLFGKFTK